jgi:hypothetical protein
LMHPILVYKNNFIGFHTFSNLDLKHLQFISQLTSISQKNSFIQIKGIFMILVER